MAKKVNLKPTEKIEQLIFLLRGRKVMLSTHLAELYGVDPNVAKVEDAPGPRRQG